jgi:hypothetical protein
LHRKLIAIQIDRNTNSKQKQQKRGQEEEDGKEQNGNGGGVAAIRYQKHANPRLKRQLMASTAAIR